MRENHPNYLKILLVLTIVIVAVLVSIHVSNFSSKIIFNSSLSDTQPKKRISILIAGDIMLDRNVRNKINEIGFDAYFSGVKDLISNADIAVANLEGPFTTFDSVTASLKNKVLQFTFDPYLAPKLAGFGFNILGLANNHTYNFGKEGFDMTKKILRSAGIKYYGDPNNFDEVSVVAEKNGMKIGLVGFHEFGYINFDKIMTEIAWLRPDVDVLIVSPHWGIEYQKEPTEKMREWAHEFIDHGADAVIGAHPHVVGNIEEYKGKKIFYSLGNFAFDQYFSEETMKGLVVEMDAEKNNRGGIDIEYKEIPIRVDKYGVSVI